MTAPINYSALGEVGFRRLCHETLREYCGPEYRSLDTGGSDGGRDGTFEGTPQRASNFAGYWVAQFKFHDVEEVGAAECRRRFLREVRAELLSWAQRTAAGQRRPDVLLFITSVPLTAVPGTGTIDRLDEIKGECSCGIPSVLVWGRADLDTEIAALPEVRARYRVGVADVMAKLVGIERALAQQVLSPGVSMSATIELATNVIYSEDKGAIIVLAEIGNLASASVTIRSVLLNLAEFAVLRPEAPITSIEVSGYRWVGPEPIRIPPEGLVRLAWLIYDRVGVRAALAARQPVSGSVSYRFFPKQELCSDVTLYTITRLREMADA